ncbi:MAG TPA: VWA domain-containing protein [Blastocatellia bacterium]|nr:VWA domain-containing protein [Blastocatellia bacterium]
MKRMYVLAIVLLILIGNTSAQTPSQSPTQPPAKEKPPETNSQNQQNPKPLIITTNMVSVTVTVSDQNRRFVTGLTKNDFEVYDDGVKQEIALFATQDSPLTLGIVYDVSGSMNPLSTQSFRALKGLFEYSHSDDEYFVVSFSDRAKLIQDFTSVPETIINKAVFIKPKGSTALFDAIYLALEKVKQGRHEKKALLIISDGEENSSRYSFGELRKALRETDAQLYAIGLGLGGSLPHITQTSGGLTFFPQEYGEVGDIYTRIALMLRNQYVVGFYPTDEGAAKRWHKLRIKVNAPKQLGKLTLFYRNGYEPSVQDMANKK